jgi:hypothetical protein
VSAELIHEKSGVRLSMVHLPAVNTPQFDWCATTLARHPQPVPPIYQPEVAAQAIVEAALSGQRSKVLGAWNKMLVAVGQVAPGFANQFAARAAWESQLTDREVSDSRPSNLHAPADASADFGSHGDFDNRAGGFLDPSFLKTLPRTAATVASAAAATAAESWRVRRGRITAAPRPRSRRG